MPKVPGFNHLRATKALERTGFKVVCQDKHVVMSDGAHFHTISRHNPVNAITMGGIVEDSKLTIAQFKDQLNKGSLTVGFREPASTGRRDEPFRRSPGNRPAAD